MIKEEIVQGMVTIGKTGIYLNAQTNSGTSITFNYVKMPNLTTFGVSNITDDQMFVLFMDYDKIKFEDLMKQLDFVSLKFNVNNYLVLSTGENKYHVISFEKFMLSEIKDILDNTLVDYSYKTLPLRIDRGHILRIRAKMDIDGVVVKDRPQFETLITRREISNDRKLSRPHVEMFSILYPQLKTALSSDKVLSEDRWDGGQRVRVIKYGTSDKDFVKSNMFDALSSSKRLSIEWINEEVW